MVNRYDSPAQAEFVNTYVPIPFQELVSIGKELNARRDAAEKMLRDANREWGKFQTMSDVDREAYNAETFGRMKPLLDQFAADPNMIKTAAGQAAISNLINNTDYGKLAQLELGAKAYAQRAENIAKLKAAGKYNADWDDVDMKNWDTLDKGVVDLSPIEYKSLEELSTPYVAAIKPSFVAGNINPKTGQKLNYALGWNAITADDLMRSLNPAMNDIIKTPQGEKWLDTYRTAIAKSNPNKDASWIESAARQALFNAMVASQSDRITALPVMDELAQNIALNKAKADAAQKQLDMFVEDYMSRMFPGVKRQTSSSFDVYASQENKNEQARLQKLRADLLKQQEIIADSVSNEDAKKDAETKKANLLKQLEGKEDFEYDAIIQGVGERLNKEISSDYYETDVTTNRDSSGKKVTKTKPFKTQWISPSTFVPTGIPRDIDNVLYSSQPVSGKRDPNNFFLHNNEFNDGWFNTKNSEFHGNEPQQFFHMSTAALMRPTDPGETKPLIKWAFGDVKDRGGLMLASVKNRQSLKPLWKWLGEKDNLLHEKANAADLNLDKVKRQDYDIEGWIRSGKVSNLYVDDIQGIDFTEDLTANDQFESLVNVYVPMEEINRQVGNFWGMSEDDEMRDAGFEIKTDDNGKEYVLVPMVYTRPYDDQMLTYVNNMFNKQIGLPDSYSKLAEHVRNRYAAMLGLTSMSEQYIPLSRQNDDE